MAQPAGASNSSPWEQFGLRNKFGKWGNNIRKESAKAKKKRLQGTGKIPRRKKKKKSEVLKDLFQSHLTEDGGFEYKDAEAFGDLLGPKQPQTFRCASHNINLLPESPRHYKSRQLTNHIRDSQYDLVMLQEIGLYWGKLDPADQWSERVRMLADSTSIFAHNTREPDLSAKLQYGGVGIVATSEVRHRMIDRGKDPSGLGRWAWMRMLGKEDHHVRFVTAYRPCASGGASSVFQQHNRALANRNPRTAILEDLVVAITEWKALGDHIILGMDANEDIRKGEVQTLLDSVGLREVILDFHRDLSPPATQNRNQRREPIDGLWATSGITISRGGYLGFGEGCPSDHRVLWFDASFSVALGQRPPDMAPLQPKRLKAKDPRLTDKYHKRVKQKMVISGFTSRFQDFKLRASIDWNLTLQQDFNKIINEDTAIRKAVESKLRHLCMGGVPWSPTIQLLRETIELWDMLVRRKKKVRVSVKRIRRFLRKVPTVRNAFSCSLAEAIRSRHLAFKAYKLVRKTDSLALRQKFQGTLAEAIAFKKGTNVEAEANNLRRRERQRKQGRNVKRMNGKLQNSRVTKLWYTEDDGHRVMCDTQISMEMACFNENESRFSQAEHTPPMTEPSLSELGRLGDSDQIEAILHGSYNAPMGTDKYMAELLNEMRMPAAIRSGIADTGLISSEISKEENRSGWTKRKLASAESSGLSMDHYAAGCSNPELNEIDTLLRALPYRHGFSPDSWQVITDVEILKKAGVYDVEKMRTIQLMHAAFNMNNKKLGRDVMAFAEKHQALAPEQFGSRKNHQSVLAALNKRLTMDLLRQRRQAGALCANDAKSCYDRIVHNVAILALRRLGMPDGPIQSMFETLQLAKHHVSTAFGISKHHYGGRREPPLQGVGQGNGAGPAIWAVISTVIISTMATQGHGFNILSAIAGVLVSFVCYAFVDDTDVIHSAPSPDTPGEVVISEMQSVLDRWGGVLRATGGALVPSKSYWYAIDFRWDGRHWKYRSIQDMPGEILITGVDGQRVVLTRHEPDVGKETLGVMQAMDGNNDAEVLHLRHKAETFAEAMRTGYLSKNDAWFALTATIMKTMEYPMATTTLTEKEWEHIMVPILRAGLPRSGIDRSFPRAVLFGPSSLQGMGVLHPWYHQEIIHLLTCLKQTLIGGITGCLISASLEQLRLELGLPGWLTDHSFRTYGGLATDSWIKQAWKFARRFKIEIRDSEAQLQDRRAHDLFLMLEFARAGFRGTDLDNLNICRMFLHSVTLSDVCTVDGTSITRDAWIGKCDPCSCTENTWPRVQARLPPRLWDLWQRALRRCFLRRGSSRLLSSPLGRWHRLPPRWQWFYSPREERLYKQEHSMWRAFPIFRVRTSARYGIAKYRWSKEVTRIRPLDLIPASVDQTQSFVLKVAMMEVLARPVDDLPPTTDVRTILDRRSAGFNWAVSEMSVDDNGLAIARALIRGNAVAVSDGSFKDSQGTSAFILEGNSNIGRLVGVNVIPGDPSSQSPYRSELGGVAGILECLHCICVAHDVTEGRVEIGLDGEQAMKEAFGHWPLDPGRPDYDMLQHIRGMIDASPLLFTSRWIESHQDDDMELASIDHWGQLNVECDGLAKSYWNTNALAKTWRPNLQFGFEKWSLWIAKKKLSKIDKKKLYAFTFSERTETYWHRKHSLTPELITSINWDACEAAMGQLPFGRKRWLIKHATGFCGVGRREFLRGNQSHDECPRCGESESSRHVVECKGTGTDLTFALALQKLETHLTVIDTAPPLLAAIIKRLRQWRKFGDHALPKFHGFDQWGTQHAVREQDNIGWYQLLLGRIALKWSDSQQRYIDSLQKRNTGRRWAISLIQKALEVAWDMWEQRNHIKHNTLHPRRAEEVARIKAKLQMLYRKGSTGLLSQDRLLFSKTKTKLLKGSPIEMLQWITSVLTATRRAATAKNDQEATMASERALMQRWLTPT